MALIVIGPEKLPRVARTLGNLMGKAQRYIADVKAEVNRTMDLEELKKMKETMEGAARDVESSVQTSAIDFEKQWNDSTAELTADTSVPRWEPPPPVYKHPGKKFRLKQAAVPQWYKARAGVRTKTLSGAARVARYRPTRLG
ncbi:MAG: Sec-independent protein translocase protein TatB [Pseudomonadota bacterium]